MRAIKVLNAEGISVEGVLTVVCYDWKTGAARLSSEGVKAFHLVHLQKMNQASNEPQRDNRNAEKNTSHVVRRTG